MARLVLPQAGATEPLVAIDNPLPPQKYLFDLASHLAAFKERIIHQGMVVEVNDCGGAAKGLRSGASFKAIAGIHIVAHGGFHVDVGIDTAWEYHQSRRGDDATTLNEYLSHGLHQKVTAKPGGRGHPG